MKDKLNYKKIAPSIVFCSFIYLIFILFLVMPKNDYSAQEKRNLSDMPEFSLEVLFDGSFSDKFEKYLSDQIPFRSFWVGTNSYYDLFSGRNGSNGVYKADDGYLITLPITESSQLVTNVGYLDEFAAKIDADTYMCVIPTNGFIMDNKLPTLHEPYNDDLIIEKINETLNGLDSRINYVNIVNGFKALSDTEQLYYKTDHHWTSLGAYECYNLLGESLGYTPTDKKAFEIESCDGFYGTSYGKAALWGCKPESLEVWRNTSHTNDSIAVSIYENGEVILSDSMFFTENLKTDDKYTVFLDGNHGYVDIVNKDNPDGEKLLMIRDSYSHCLAPFLADNYSEIILVDLRYYKETVSTLVCENKIDKVLIVYGLDSIVNGTDIAYLF